MGSSLDVMCLQKSKALNRKWLFLLELGKNANFKQTCCAAISEVLLKRRPEPHTHTHVAFSLIHQIMKLFFDFWIYLYKSIWAQSDRERELHNFSNHNNIYHHSGEKHFELHWTHVRHEEFTTFTSDYKAVRKSRYETINSLHDKCAHKVSNAEWRVFLLRIFAHNNTSIFFCPALNVSSFPLSFFLCNVKWHFSIEKPFMEKISLKTNISSLLSFCNSLTRCQSSNAVPFPHQCSAWYSATAPLSPSNNKSKSGWLLFHVAKEFFDKCRTLENNIFYCLIHQTATFFSVFDRVLWDWLR